MPTIYHYTDAYTVTQERYDVLIKRPGWYATSTIPPTDKTAGRPRSTPGVHVPIDWGKYWFPKMRAAIAGQGQAQLAWLGSSSMQGYYASDLDKTSSFALVRDALQGVGGNGGSGYRGAQFSDTFLSGAPSGAYNLWKTKFNNAWTQTLNGGAISTPTFDLGPSGYLAISGGATVDIPFQGSQLALWFFNSHSSSPFTYAIDGGSPTTITPGAGLGNDLVMISMIVATGLSKGWHSVRITGGTTAVRFVGIDGENPVGVVCNNYAIAGMQSDRYANIDTYESGTYMGGHRFRNRYGVTPTETTPDLLIISVPPNDAIKASQDYTVTTNTNTTVNSASFRRSDVGRTITGTGIPAGTTITAVSEAVSATISQAATASATITATITNPDAVNRFVKNWEQYLAGVLDNVYGGGTVVQGQTDVLIIDPMMKINSDTVRPTWRRIQGEARALADVYGAAYLNMGATLNQSWSRFYNLGYMGNGANPESQALGSDDIHLSDKGMKYTADAILKIVMP